MFVFLFFSDGYLLTRIKLRYFIIWIIPNKLITKLWLFIFQSLLVVNYKPTTCNLCENWNKVWETGDCGTIDIASSLDSGQNTRRLDAWQSQPLLIFCKHFSFFTKMHVKQVVLIFFYWIHQFKAPYVVWNMSRQFLLEQHWSW